MTPLGYHTKLARTHECQSHPTCQTRTLCQTTCQIESQNMRQMPQRMPDRMLQRMSDNMSEHMSDRMPYNMPARTSDYVAKKKCQIEFRIDVRKYAS